MITITELLNENFKTARRELVDRGYEEDTVRDFLERFKKLSDENKLRGNEKNIDWWVKHHTGQELFDFIAKKEKEVTVTQINTKKVSGNRIVLDTTNKFKAQVPLDKAASCNIGKHTDWCTTKVNELHFEDYFREGIVLVYFTEVKTNKPVVALAVKMPSDGEGDWYNILEDDYGEDNIEAFDPKDNEVNLQDAFYDILEGHWKLEEIILKILKHEKQIKEAQQKTTEALKDLLLQKYAEGKINFVVSHANDLYSYNYTEYFQKQKRWYELEDLIIKRGSIDQIEKYISSSLYKTNQMRRPGASSVDTEWPEFEQFIAKYEPRDLEEATEAIDILLKYVQAGSLKVYNTFNPLPTIERWLIKYPRAIRPDVLRHQSMMSTILKLVAKHGYTPQSDKFKNYLRDFYVMYYSPKRDKERRDSLSGSYLLGSVDNEKLERIFGINEVALPSFVAFTQYLEENYKTARRQFVAAGADDHVVSDIFDRFRKLSADNKLQGDEKNIDWWAKNKSFDDLKTFVVNKEKEITKTQVNTKKVVVEGDRLQVFENEWYIGVMPLTKNASCNIGKHTSWCVTKPNDTHWEDYVYESGVVLVYYLNKVEENEPVFAQAIYPGGKRVEYFDVDDDRIQFDYAFPKVEVNEYQDNYLITQEELLDVVNKIINPTGKIKQAIKKLRTRERFDDRYILDSKDPMLITKEIGKHYEKMKYSQVLQAELKAINVIKELLGIDNPGSPQNKEYPESFIYNNDASTKRVEYFDDLFSFMNNVRPRYIRYFQKQGVDSARIKSISDMHWEELSILVLQDASKVFEWVNNNYPLEADPQVQNKWFRKYGPDIFQVHSHYVYTASTSTVINTLPKWQIDLYFDYFTNVYKAKLNFDVTNPDIFEKLDPYTKWMFKNDPRSPLNKSKTDELTTESFDFLIENFKTVRRKYMTQGAESDEVIAYLNRFRKLNDDNKLRGDNKDIDKVAKALSWEQFKNWIEKIEQQPSQTQINKKKLVGNRVVIYEDDEYIAEVPLDKEASCNIGKHTDWCVSKPNQSYFEEYFNEQKVPIVMVSRKLEDKPEPEFAMAIKNTEISVKFDAIMKDVEIEPYKVLSRLWTILDIDGFDPEDNDTGPRPVYNSLGYKENPQPDWGSDEFDVYQPTKIAEIDENLAAKRIKGIFNGLVDNLDEIVEAMYKPIDLNPKLKQIMSDLVHGYVGSEHALTQLHDMLSNIRDSYRINSRNAKPKTEYVFDEKIFKAIEDYIIDNAISPEGEFDQYDLRNTIGSLIAYMSYRIDNGLDFKTYKVQRWIELENFFVAIVELIIEDYIHNYDEQQEINGMTDYYRKQLEWILEAISSYSLEVRDTSALSRAINKIREVFSKTEPISAKKIAQDLYKNMHIQKYSDMIKSALGDYLQIEGIDESVQPLDENFKTARRKYVTDGAEESEVKSYLDTIEKEENKPIFEVGDVFGISFSKEHEIVTEIIGFLDDGIIIELDDVAIGILEKEGVVFLEGELINQEKQKGIDGKVCWKGYALKGTKIKNGKTVDNCVKIKENDDIDEAKYQGREVPLGKKLPGDVKKSKVYVRKPNGNVVKVNFGDKKMRIRKSNPKARKSFRARHNCKDPGPRWKARYWSCKSW